MRPKRDSSSTVVRGAAHSSRSVSSRPPDSRMEPAANPLANPLSASLRSVASQRRASAISVSLAASTSLMLWLTLSMTARGMARPKCPRVRNRQRVWRDTPKSLAARSRPCHTA